jgi:hypothetical protein
MKQLICELLDLVRSARQAVVHSVNVIQVLTNFEIGRRIVVHEQQGKERAKYGTALLKALSVELTAEFGRGFSLIVIWITCGNSIWHIKTGLH